MIKHSYCLLCHRMCKRKEEMYIVFFLFFFLLLVWKLRQLSLQTSRSKSYISGNAKSALTCLVFWPAIHIHTHDLMWNEQRYLWKSRFQKWSTRKSLGKMKPDFVCISLRMNKSWEKNFKSWLVTVNIVLQHLISYVCEYVGPLM